jgi:excisionase family DNA binding protein
MPVGPKIPLSIALAADVPQSSMNNGRDPTGNGQGSDPTVVACVVFQTQDPERLVELLRQALTGIPEQVRLQPPDTASLSLERSPQDFWLKHAEAAEYLGVSKSTLYQYACQQKIECRKLAGRLEYRRSTLDQFKDRQIRPAHPWFPRRGIIPPALGSGK